MATFATNFSSPRQSSTFSGFNLSPGSLLSSRFSFVSSTSAQSGLPEYSLVGDGPDINALPPRFSLLSQPTSDEQSHHNPPPTPAFTGHTGTRFDPLGYSVVGPQHCVLVGRATGDGANPYALDAWPPHPIIYPFYVATNANAKPWATMRIWGASPLRDGRNPKVPFIWGGGSVKGEVALDIEPGTEQMIHEVSLLFRGRILTGARTSQYFTFCEETLDIWKNGLFCPPPSSSGAEPVGPFPSNSKFTGSHIFPFRFPTPTHVNLSNRQAASPRSASNTAPTPTSDQACLAETPSPRSLTFKLFRNRTSTSGVPNSTATTECAFLRQGSPSHLSSTITSATVNGKEYPVLCPLPHSAQPSHVPVQIRYDFVLRITHGRRRTQTKIQAPIQLMPRLVRPSRAPTPAFDHTNISLEEVLRSASTPIFGEDGWLGLQPITIAGILSVDWVALPVSVGYELFFQRPLAHLRGDSIRIVLGVESPTVKGAEEVFGSPEHLDVRLMRRLEYLNDVVSHRNLIRDEGTGKVLPDDIGYGVYWSPTMGGSVGNNTGRGKSVEDAPEMTVAVAQWESIVIPDVDEHVRSSGCQSFLLGTIKLPKDIEPSSSCTIYNQQYYVEFFAPRHPKFAPNPLVSNTGTGLGPMTAYASQLVEIATLSHV